MQMVSAIGAPLIARMHSDQRPALMLVVGLVAAGVWLLLVGPASLRWPAAVILGLGQGGVFSLALTLIVLRSGSAILAGDLSAFAQGGGYALAALGPLMVGLMLDANVGITGITGLLLAILAFTAIMALLAGRQRCLVVDESGELVTVDQRR